MPADPLEVEVDETGSAFLVRLRGELDMSTVDQVRDCFEGVAWDEKPTLVVDLRELAFIDSSGLHAIVRLERHARDASRRLFLVRGPSAIARVFEVAGLANEFHWLEPADID
jgi:anti-sigma B factor antagonist